MEAPPAFELWIEAEELAEPVDDFCNIRVALRTGEVFALNVWTFDFFDRARRQGEELASPKLAAYYMLPPDLVVAELRRAVLQPVVEDLLTRGLVPAHCRVDDD